MLLLLEPLSHTQSFVCSQLSGLVSRCEVCHREKSTKYSFNLKEVKGMTSPAEKSAGANQKCRLIMFPKVRKVQQIIKATKQRNFHIKEERMFPESNIFK